MSRLVRIRRPRDAFVPLCGGLDRPVNPSQASRGRLGSLPTVLLGSRWQQIEFRCSPEVPAGSETSFGAVSKDALAAKRVSVQRLQSRRKSPLGKEPISVVKTTEIGVRMRTSAALGPLKSGQRTLWNVLTTPKLVLLPTHPRKLLRNSFCCQKDPGIDLAQCLAPPDKVGAPGMTSIGRGRHRRVKRQSNAAGIVEHALYQHGGNGEMLCVPPIYRFPSPSRGHN